MKINLDNLKFRKVAVISDPHLFHQREFVWGARGFKSEQEHRDKILVDLRTLLDPEDILICLGDMFLNTDPEDAERIVRSIPCRTLFLFGNHPSGIKQMYEKSLELFNIGTTLGVNPDIFPLEIEDGKYVVGDQFFMVANKKTYYCSHFAPLTWDKMKHGYPVLCGHSHGNFLGINPNQDKFGKVLDCGVDNALKFVGRSFFWLDEINPIINKKEIKIWDHH